jgi:hypothetical protein
MCAIDRALVPTRRRSSPRKCGRLNGFNEEGLCCAVQPLAIDRSIECAAQHSTAQHSTACFAPFSLHLDLAAGMSKSPVSEASTTATAAAATARADATTAAATLSADAWTGELERINAGLEKVESRILRFESDPPPVWASPGAYLELQREKAELQREKAELQRQKTLLLERTLAPPSVSTEYAGTRRRELFRPS